MKLELIYDENLNRFTVSSIFAMHIERIDPTGAWCVIPIGGGGRMFIGTLYDCILYCTTH